MAAVATTNKDMEQMLIAFDNYVKKATGKKNFLKKQIDSVFNPLIQATDTLTKQINKIDVSKFGTTIKGFETSFQNLFKQIEKEFKEGLGNLNTTILKNFKTDKKGLSGVLAASTAGMGLIAQNTDRMANGIEAMSKNIVKSLNKNFDVFYHNIAPMVEYFKDASKTDSAGSIKSRSVGSGTTTTPSNKNQNINTADDERRSAEMSAALIGSGGGVIGEESSRRNEKRKGMWDYVKTGGKKALGLGGLVLGGTFLVKAYQAYEAGLAAFNKDTGKMKIIGNLMSRTGKFLSEIPHLFKYLKTFFSGGEEAVKLGGALKPGFFKNLLKLGGSSIKLPLKVLNRLPYVGSLISAGFAYKRFKAGDWVGGTLDTLSAIANLFPGIGSAVSFALDGLSMLRDFALGGSDEAAKLSFSEQNTKIWEYVKTELWPKLKQKVKDFGDFLWNSVNDLAQQTVDSFLQSDFFKNNSNWIVPLTMDIKNAWDSVYEFFTKDIPDFFTGLGVIYDTLKIEVENWWENSSIKKGIDAVWNFFGEVGDFFVDLYHKVSDFFEPVRKTLEPVTNWLSDAASKLIDGVWNIGKSIVDAVWNFIVSAKDKVVNTFKELGSGAWDKLKSWTGQTVDAFKFTTELGRQKREMEEMQKKLEVEAEENRKKAEELKIETSKKIEIDRMELDAKRKELLKSVAATSDNSAIVRQLQELNQRIEKLDNTTLSAGVLNAQTTAKASVASNQPTQVTQIFGGAGQDIDRLRLNSNRVINMPIGT